LISDREGDSIFVRDGPSSRPEPLRLHARPLVPRPELLNLAAQPLKTRFLPRSFPNALQNGAEVSFEPRSHPVDVLPLKRGLIESCFCGHVIADLASSPCLRNPRPGSLAPHGGSSSCAYAKICITQSIFRPASRWKWGSERGSVADRYKRLQRKTLQLTGIASRGQRDEPMAQFGVFYLCSSNLDGSKRRPGAIVRPGPNRSNGVVSGSWRGSCTYLQQIRQIMPQEGKHITARPLSRQALRNLSPGS
jgi:hypothetical protein